MKNPFAKSAPVALVALIAACAIRAPPPLPRIALACYSISADGWTDLA